MLIRLVSRFKLFDAILIKIFRFLIIIAILKIRKVRARRPVLLNFTGFGPVGLGVWRYQRLYGSFVNHYRAPLGVVWRGIYFKGKALVQAVDMHVEVQRVALFLI
jgi:hypothetical protein